MSTAAVATVDFDLTDPAVNNDVHAYYREAREAGPVVFNTRMERWMFGRYAEVRKTLGDEQHFETDKVFFDTLFGARVFNGEDNPRHNEMRSTWDRYFRRKDIGERRPLFEEIAHARIDLLAERLEAGETVDFMNEVAIDMMTRVITRILGISQDRLGEWSTWADDVFTLATDLTKPRQELLDLQAVPGFRAVQAMCAAGGEELEARRSSGDESDLIGLLANSPVAETMTEAEQQGQIGLIFMAGHESTAKFMTNALLVLHRHPEQRRALVEDPSLLPIAIQEILRQVGGVGPVQRVAKAGAQVGGVPIPEGDLLIALPSAANRDPRRWERPDAFDIHREFLPNIGFGFGTHNCIGQHLAKASAEIIIGRVLEKLPDYHVVESDAEIDYGSNWLNRGPMELHLRL